MSTKKKITIGIIVLLILAFIVVMINVMQIPEVIRCERLTAKYGKEFEDPELYKDAHWGGVVHDIKVLQYTLSKAEVYYIMNSDDGYSEQWGKIVGFNKNSQGLWEIQYEVVKWTHGTGNADGVVMPYWWHNLPS